MNVSHGHYRASLYRLPRRTRLASWWRRLPEWQRQIWLTLAFLAFFFLLSALVYLVDWMVP